MRPVRSLFGLIFLCLLQLSTAAYTPPRSATHVDGRPTLSKQEQRLQYMRWFVRLSPDDYGKWRGKSLNFFERLSFRATQKRMKQQLSFASSSNSEGVNWGGLALGLVLGPIGVLGAYIFSEDDNLRKWAWIGCGLLAVILILVLI